MSSGQGGGILRLLSDILVCLVCPDPLVQLREVSADAVSVALGFLGRLIDDPLLVIGGACGEHLPGEVCQAGCGKIERAEGVESRNVHVLLIARNRNRCSEIKRPNRCHHGDMDQNELVKPCQVCNSPAHEKLVPGEPTLNERHAYDVVRVCNNRQCPTNTGDASPYDV